MMKKKRRNSYQIFTLIFLAMLPCIYYVFLVNHKSLVWDRDGLRQHYNSLIYIGRWGREIIKNIFVAHKFEIPMWDFHIGYGSDIITTFHYYVIGDPLSLASIFVPSKYTEYLYGALILLRMYLSGISFIYYCKYMKKSDTAALGAALNYVFCGYMIYSAVRHPYFVNPMIYLPLLLVGAERIFEKKKPTLFIFMVFISASSNFYFFYMIVLAVCIYVGVRFFTFRHTNLLKEMITVIAKFAGFAIVGVSMSAAILYPILTQFFQTNRLELKQNFPLFYHPGYYLRLIPSFISIGSFENWTVLGLTAPALLAVFILFGMKKKYLHLKLVFCAFTAMLCIPFFGMAFNGFSYVSNRWCFLYAVLLSYIIATVWDDMVLMKNTSKRFVLAAGAFYTAFFIIARLKTGKMLFLPIIILVLLIAVAFAASRLQTKKNIYRIACICFLSLTLLHAVVNSYELYSPNRKRYASAFLNTGTALNTILESAPGAALKHIKKADNSFYRFESDDREVLNTATIVKENSIQYYWSLENSIIPRYLKDMSLRSFIIYNYKDLDHRTFLDALAGVRYFVQEFPCDIPYGYELNDRIALSERKVYNVYENKYALPLAYTYDSCIPEQDYLDLQDYERQEALLQGIVLHSDSENGLLKDFPKTDLSLTAKPVSYTMTLDKSIKQKSDGTFFAKKKNAKIKLSFTGQKNCETYLSLRGTEIKPHHKKRNELSVRVKSNDSKNKMRYMSDTHKNFKNQKNYLINLGYHENAQTKITITLPTRGTYRFDQIEVICQPMANYPDLIEKRKEHTLDHETIETNTVTGDISLTERKLLCFSIPYSKGWRAWVDGTKQELLRANVMYMALPLEKGTHEIRLEYRTPGLGTGMILSLIGFILFLGIIIYGRKKQ